MQRILVVSAIATLLSTTMANFLNFSKKNLLRLELTKPEQESSEAFLVNFDQNIEFLAREEQDHYVAKFNQNPEPDPSRPVYNHPECDNFVGIYIKELGQFFCRVNSFDIKLYHCPGDKQTIRISLIFFIPKTGALILEIPLLGRPTKVKSFDPEKLDEWANKLEVGTEVPVSPEKLKSASSIKKMAVDFLWLSNLLTKGVTKGVRPDINTGTQSAIYTYIARPLVVPHEYMEECLELIAALNNPPAESEGSN